GYKSKKALFKHMRKVSITYINDTYKISPSHQDGLDYSFTGLSKADEIILPNDATDEELGQAVRLAYEKCTSIY
ncbi:contact-dependent growth inhibition system immunity protein, partial [Acinetobacter baumannii]